jgi:hypothetical protein
MTNVRTPTDEREPADVSVVLVQDAEEGTGSEGPVIIAVASAEWSSSDDTEGNLRRIKAADQPWQEKWRQMFHQLQRLHEIYEQEDRTVSDLDVEACVNGFFSECDGLADWLGLDVSVPTDLGEKARSYSLTGVLKDCDAVSNSHKHKELTHSGKTTARISTVTSNSGRWTAVIDLDWPSGGGGRSVDALELAEQCVNAWRSFLAGHALAEP